MSRVRFGACGWSHGVYFGRLVEGRGGRLGLFGALEKSLVEVPGPGAGNYPTIDGSTFLSGMQTQQNP